MISYLEALLYMQIKSTILASSLCCTSTGLIEGCGSSHSEIGPVLSNVVNVSGLCVVAMLSYHGKST